MQAKTRSSCVPRLAPSLSPVTQSTRLNERLHLRLPERRLDFLQLACWPGILVSMNRPSVFLCGVLVPVQHVIQSSSQTTDPVELVLGFSGCSCQGKNGCLEQLFLPTQLLLGMGSYLEEPDTIPKDPLFQALHFCGQNVLHKIGMCCSRNVP